jgi:hypothetical protein
MFYYALLTGAGEGCDYTIGYNETYFKLKSTNLEDSKKELKRYLQENEPEDGWGSAIILECTKEVKKVFCDQEWSDE